MMKNQLGILANLDSDHEKEVHLASHERARARKVKSPSGLNPLKIKDLTKELVQKGASSVVESKNEAEKEGFPKSPPTKQDMPTPMLFRLSPDEDKDAEVIPKVSSEKEATKPVAMEGKGIKSRSQPVEENCKENNFGSKSGGFGAEFGSEGEYDEESSFDGSEEGAEEESDHGEDEEFSVDSAWVGLLLLW
ncbi:hypothetical protein U1Q18_047841 [Sarracenia purpurea var. burkii]